MAIIVFHSPVGTRKYQFFGNIFDSYEVVAIIDQFLQSQVQGSVALAVSRIRISAKFNQRLHIFQVQRNHCKVQRRSALIISVRDFDFVQSLEQKNRHDPIVHLGGTMMNCLLTCRLGIHICLKMNNKRLNYHKVARRCC